MRLRHRSKRFRIRQMEKAKARARFILLLNDKEITPEAVGKRAVTRAPVRYGPPLRVMIGPTHQEMVYTVEAALRDYLEETQHV